MAAQDYDGFGRSHYRVTIRETDVSHHMAGSIGDAAEAAKRYRGYGPVTKVECYYDGAWHEQGYGYETGGGSDYRAVVARIEARHAAKVKASGLFDTEGR